MSANKIVSSLTDDEFRKIIWDENGGALEESVRAIADAAAQRAIEDLEVPSFHWFQINKDTDQSSELFINIISRHINDLKKGTL